MQRRLPLELAEELDSLIAKNRREDVVVERPLYLDPEAIEFLQQQADVQGCTIEELLASIIEMTEPLNRSNIR